MNTKTTLTLAFALVVLVLLYVVVQSGPGAAETDTAPLPPVSSSSTTRDLLETKLGDVTKIVCRRKDGEEWVFEKDEEPSTTGQAVWRMTSPAQMKCVRWEVERIANGLKNLRYELSYKPGEPGAITASEAGLDPPETIVTLTDADGQTVTVQIGKPASAGETYVRVAGSDEIRVGKSDLSNLVKEKALDYREKQLWDFKAENVTRVEIADRSDAQVPVSYVFTRDGARWMMESPVTARATSKVDDMLRTMGRLRAIAWYDDRPEKLAMYGLEPSALTVRVTVEEEVPVEKGEEKEAPTDEGGESTESTEGDEDETEEEQQLKTEKKITVYELHLSDRSPIGEDAKTYMRIGDEHAVATVMKSTADRFRPVMSEWREMRITTVDTTAATRIELTTPEGNATLVRSGGEEWLFQPDGGRAEDSVVTELLDAVADLKAVAFVDQEPVDLTSFGLDSPRAEVRLTIPGVEGVERIAVGGFTDERVKRLVYVRRNELSSIGKVRRTDVDKLLQGPRVYRNRTIIDVLPSRFERLALSTENRLEGGRNEVVFERSGNAWTMVEPVSSEVREEQMDKLVEALGGLHAEQVVADESEASAYGLHAPAVTLTLTYKPPTEYRIEEEPGGEESEETAGASDVSAEDEGGGEKRAVPVEVQPPSRTLELSVTEHDGRYYARRADRSTIYRVGSDFYRVLLAEYRSDRVMDFDDAKVRKMSIRKGEETHVFVKKDNRWVYEAEPDLPLDDKKIDNLLLQIRDLRTNRYVRHVVDDLATYGLVSPLHEVTVTLDDDTERTLWVSEKRGIYGTDAGFYATVKDRAGVFLLTPASIKRFEVSLDELEASR